MTKNTLRAIRFLVAEALRVDGRRAVLAALASVGAYISSPSIAVFMKGAANGLQAGNVQATMVSGAIVALLVSALTLLGTVASKMRIATEERTGFAMEGRLITLESQLPGLEHHENPYFVDQWDLLRSQHFRLGQGLGAILLMLGVAGQATLTAILLLQVSPFLLLLPLFGIPLLVVGKANQTLAKRTEESVTPSIRQVNHLLDVAIYPALAKEPRALGTYKFLRTKLRRAWRQILTTTSKSILRSSLLSVAGWTIFGFGYGAAIGYVAFQARSSGDVGNLVLVIMLAGQVHASLNGTVSTYSYLQNQFRVVHRFLWISEYVTEKSHDPSGVSRSVICADSLTVKFQHVTFQYPGSNQPVLRDVSLVMESPATIAVVGSNGAGKTTLVKLLLGYYEPSEGVILINGTPLGDIDTTYWRRLCTAVFQDFSKFEFHLGEAVGVGFVEDVKNDSAIRRAIDEVEGRLAIWNMPTGLDAQLGPTFGGVEPSTGQWQAISIARSRMSPKALVRFLDEPSASLDTDTEAKIFSGYDSLSRDKNQLLILVSHRLANVRSADKIYLLEQGSIIEEGTHNELMAREGRYAALFSMQANAYA